MRVLGFCTTSDPLPVCVCAAELMKFCDLLSNTLTDKISGPDVDASDLCTKLHILANMVPQNNSSLKCLQIIYENNLQDSFPNVSVTLCIALTIPVTVPSAECSFLNVKQIMSDL